MNKEELMIGDWVMYDNEPKQVQEILFDEVTIECWPKSITEIEPIPLSKDILEKNGFKKFKFHDIEGQHQWTWWKDTLTNISLWCRELNDDTKDGWMIRIESPLATLCLKIEFLHELQHTLRLCGIDKEIVI